MIERVVTCALHNTRRNGQRTAAYWSVEEEITDENVADEEGYLNEELISTYWPVSKLPKRLKDVLDTADEDPEGYALKKGEFRVFISSIEEYGDLDPKQVYKIEKL